MNSISGSASASYTYDYSGRRSAKTASGTTTTHLYDGLNVIAETGSSTTYHLFGPGVDEALASSSGSSVVYGSLDGLGSLVLSTDINGIAQNSYTYDAWGVSRSSLEAFPQSFRYTARENGDIADQLFYRARFLIPATGRFLSEDPLRFVAGPNWYQYADDRPSILTDPEGMCPWQVRERPTQHLEDHREWNHQYFYNTATGQSLGLGPALPWVEPFFSHRGRWENHENPAHTPSDRRLHDVPEPQCTCVDKKVKSPGPPPGWCANGFHPSPPMSPFSNCVNCQGWVNSVLESCQ